LNRPKQLKELQKEGNGIGLTFRWAEK